MTEVLYKIGDVARRLGTTARTLRFYEEQGLIAATRTEKGTRRYAEADVARFEVILHLARLGVPLKEIHRLATTRPQSRSGDEASRRVAALLATMRTEAEERRRAYETLEQEIARAEALVHQCFGCQRPPTRKDCASCPVAQGMEQASLLHLIWDQKE
ncbi:MAG: MerR family transcriptional regulator [Pseudomonadota bacterium]|uniref:MerR family transcriptional regulator n=1 Tax=Thermithiobacillus tepidarius TaxID=929 RepID=UPI00056FA483|nr:MerR family transcriptional regulator [Thermithiobacillus tepidarius]